MSEASAYRILKAHDLITSPAFIVVKAADEFKDKTTAPNQLWQTDFTYLKVTGWGWFYLSTILDDFSRYIVAWKLCTTMKAGRRDRHADHGASSLGARQHERSFTPAATAERQRLESYIASDLADWLEDHDMDHVRGAPMHPQTQGKIERWHQTLKNRILLENYYLPGDLSPNSHPVEGRARSSFEPAWLGGATGRGAEPPVERSVPPRCMSGALRLA